MLNSETTSYDTFRDDFAGQFKRMSKAKRPTFVLRGGKAAAVVLSPKEFEAYAAARERQDVLDAVEQGQREFAAGGGMTVDEFKRRVRASMKSRSTKRSKSKA